MLQFQMTFAFHSGTYVPVGVRQNKSADLDIGMHVPVVASTVFVVVVAFVELSFSVHTTVPLGNWSH